MTWPVTFGTLTSPASTGLFDQQFAAVAGTIEIPCTASGSNNISLTPLPNCPTLPAYSELCAFKFRAAANSTGTVSAQFAGLPLIYVYLADGVTHASTASLIAGQLYMLYYSASLAAGAGGFFIASPAIANVTNTAQGLPGGRLTLVSAQPVVTSTVNSQTIWYAPYVSPLVPIYNGTSVQMVQFTAGGSDGVGLSLAMGGATSWPAGGMFDVFVTLVSGLPVLATVQWTNSTTRAVPLAIFAGFLTNSATAAARVNGAAAITIQANQGTFLGSFYANANGNTAMIFGGSAAGGTIGSLLVANYYNGVQITSISIDTQASYTYTSSTPREAGGGSGMHCSLALCASERVVQVNFLGAVSTTAVVGSVATDGISINTVTGYQAYQSGRSASANVTASPLTINYAFTGAGFFNVFAAEAGDGSHANTFNLNSFQQLMVTAWL
jgi:hypothetical protein